jgi:hypothetical protein
LSSCTAPFGSRAPQGGALKIKPTRGDRPPALVEREHEWPSHIAVEQDGDAIGAKTLNGERTSPVSPAPEFVYLLD